MKEVERIIRVDHAGEYGAVNIYRAQLLIAKRFYKDIQSNLEEMLAHEQEHLKIFNGLLQSRGIRSCHALGIWGLGGFLVGLFTAVMGRRAIWVCTDSIESTVLHHLEWQLAFLEQHDREVHNAVLSIKSDEEAHQDYGAAHGSGSIVYAPIFLIVRYSTKFAIWLSTKL